MLANLLGLRQTLGRADIDAIVCMGDTLTHLPARDDVSRLLSEAYGALRPGGRLVLAFRDLTEELTGTDRSVRLTLALSELVVDAIHQQLGSQPVLLRIQRDEVA